MMSGGDKMKEPMLRIPVLGIQHGHMLLEFQHTYRKKRLLFFERVNFIRLAGEMDSTGEIHLTRFHLVFIRITGDWGISLDILELFTRSGVHSAGP